MNGKVWSGTIPAGQLAEYENRLQIVNLRNEADGRISVRYLAENPGSKILYLLLAETWKTFNLLDVPGRAGFV